jgi:hypothetical protein
MNVIRRIFSILVCLLRLVIVLMITTFSALNKILFDKMEIISATLIMRPQAPERTTLGFIDDLYANNREFAQGGSIPEANAFDNNDPFIPDDILTEGEEEITFDGEDIQEEDLPPEDSLEEQDPKKKKHKKDDEDNNEG